MRDIVFKTSPPMVAIVCTDRMTIDSAWYTWSEAKQRARSVWRLTPCEIMLLVRDDHGRVIGVQELTREEKRELGSWRPIWQMRPEDVVNHKHKLDPFIVRQPVPADAG